MHMRVCFCFTVRLERRYHKMIKSLLWKMCRLIPVTLAFVTGPNKTNTLSYVLLLTDFELTVKICAN